MSRMGLLTSSTGADIATSLDLPLSLRMKLNESLIISCSPEACLSPDADHAPEKSTTARWMDGAPHPSFPL